MLSSCFFVCDVTGEVQSMADKGKIFRDLHTRRGTFVIPNPWDVGSARILAALGFEALATTSAGLAFSLGMVEGNVSREDTLSHCRAIVSATPLPVSADLEKGFGDAPEAVVEAVRTSAAIGLAGCSIEDFTGCREDPIFEFGQAVERVTAAAEAARSLPQDFVLTARCENLLWGHPGLDDVVTRLQAYERAGADVLYAPGLPDLGAIREVCRAISKPVNVVMGLPGTVFTVEELAEAGVKRISVGSAFARLAYGSLVCSAREITEEGSFTFAANAMGFAELEGYFRSSGQ
jgi:2-methylisocitrate lyase-like PEP mutase family enzyme